MKITGNRLVQQYHKVDLDHKLKKKHKRINTKSVRLALRKNHD